MGSWCSCRCCCCCAPTEEIAPLLLLRATANGRRHAVAHIIGRARRVAAGCVSRCAAPLPQALSCAADITSDPARSSCNLNPPSFAQAASSSSTSTSRRVSGLCLYCPATTGWAGCRAGARAWSEMRGAQLWIERQAVHITNTTHTHQHRRLKAHHQHHHEHHHHHHHKKQQTTPSSRRRSPSRPRSTTPTSTRRARSASTSSRTSGRRR